MKDLSRVERQIESLMKQINPLKHELALLKKKDEEAQATLQRADVINERKLLELKEECNDRESQLKEVLQLHTMIPSLRCVFHRTRTRLAALV